MNRRILLINPNTYKAPSAIPLGLEYVGASLEKAGWNVKVADLCFSGDPVGDTTRVVREYDPLLTGVTIRNIDTALFQDNIYFVPGIQEIVIALKSERVPVILGGAGFSAAPELILDAVRADYGVKGPAERAVITVAEAIGNGDTPDRITDGWKAGIEPDFVPRRPFGVDFTGYIQNRGIPGFTTHYGCNRHCEYCIEAETPLIYRNPDSVVQELRILSDAGYHQFHLCDSEFNHDLSYSENFTDKLARSDIGIKWSLYMQPAPWSRKLFKSLKNSGSDIITLSVDSSIINRTGSFYSYDDLKSVIELAVEFEVRIAVDLSTGLPGETERSTIQTIEFLKKNLPSTVGVNSFFRVYPGTIMEKSINQSQNLRKNLLTPHGETGLIPNFYNHLSVDKLMEIIGEHPGFRIEGFDLASNYERLKE